MFVVHGICHLPRGLKPFARARLHVRILDTTYVDAPSIEVASVSFDNPGWGAGETVSFSLRLDEADPSRRYEIQGHLDMQGDGEIRRGDAISLVSYPVITQGHPLHVELDLVSI